MWTKQQTSLGWKGFCAVVVSSALLNLMPATFGGSTNSLPKAAPQESDPVAFPAEHLHLSFEGVSDLKTVQDKPRGQMQGIWTGTVGETKLTIRFLFFDRKRFRFSEPKDVLDVAEYNLPAPEGKDPKQNGLTNFLSTEYKAGEYGYVPVAWLGIHAPKDGTRVSRHELHFAGLTENVGYTVEVQTDPRLTEADKPAIMKWLWSCITYDGPVRVAEWTDGEAEARWKRDAPDKVYEKGTFVMLRTKYYLILTNVGKSTTKAFGKKLDENYEIIRGVYPFEDTPAQRLLPIFYFVQDIQYHDWCEKIFKDRKETSAGVAYGDVYSTYHQSINAPVHIHEATHQIFKNRLFLGGGGSWFQEGVAEYMSASPGELGSMKSLVKRDAYKKFHQFLTMGSLLGDADTGRVTGGSDAGESYAQAAAIIEFVRHSKFGADKFLEFVHTVGKVPRGNLKEIEAALQKVYKVDVAGFEEAFKKYWSARKKRKKIKTPKRPKKSRK